LRDYDACVKRLLVGMLAVAACLAPAALAAPEFRASIERISPELRERMTGKSWHRGCPVRIRDLRLIRLTHWGFDREVRWGYLVVNRWQAYRMRRVMRKLFDARFPIRRMRLVDRYGANDRRSMNANNTSAFNCRFVAGTTRWSEHAYGRAIDINPIQNPYVSGGVASPAAGQAYVDRSQRRKGMIHAGGRVVRAFAGVGWEWGGYWSSPKDYQHFSRTGR
jgi:D-alanyl-D-alanine carboxypeptidase-like protein